MKVFVTGGTGYVGTVLVERLVKAGYAVTGLARSAPSAEALTAAGATPLRGSLTDVDLLRAAATDADAVRCGRTTSCSLEARTSRGYLYGPA